MAPLVSVLALNYKQMAYLPSCLDSLVRQTYPAIEVFFTDNASEDGAVGYVKSNYPFVQVIANDSNLYFSRAHNTAIRKSRGDYVLPLNLDAVLKDDFIEQMVLAMELDPKVGMASGKLLKMDNDLRPLTPPIIDSTGLWFTPEIRHFDRGAGEKDEGQYNLVEYIFGPSGAVPLYRREMLEDIAFQGEYFDEDFVIYREDAELAWRAQLLGWKGLYTPSAVAFHVRRVRPTDRRDQIAPELNMHSVKNRFLMRAKNQTFRQALRFLWPTLRRDMLVFGYVALVERTSLPAFAKVFKLLPRMMAKRRHIMQRKRVSDQYISQWFSFTPEALPYPPVSLP
jgi:GT2 family glycosyltransferase